MSDSNTPAFEQLQTDLFALMHHYPERPNSMTALAIAVTLNRILRHPLIELFPEFRDQCVKGLQRWKLRAHCSAPLDSGVSPQPLPGTLH